VSNASLGFPIPRHIEAFTSRQSGNSQFAARASAFAHPPSPHPYHADCLRRWNTSSSFDDTTAWAATFTLVLSQPWPISRWPEPDSCWWLTAASARFLRFAAMAPWDPPNCLSGNKTSPASTSRRHRLLLGTHRAALSLHLGSQVLDRATIWFGFRHRSRHSVTSDQRPAVTFSSTATDFLGNTPSYIRSGSARPILRTALLRQADVRLTTPFWPCLPGLVD